MRTFRIALARINETVGDRAGNAERIAVSIEQARTLGRDRRLPIANRYRGHWGQVGAHRGAPLRQ